MMLLLGLVIDQFLNKCAVWGASSYLLLYSKCLLMRLRLLLLMFSHHLIFNWSLT